MASLPYADMDFSLRTLAGRAEGFGRFSIGGLHGSLYSMMGEDHYVRVAGDKNQCGAVFEVSGTTIIQGIGEFMLLAQA
ncbi:hypothetical protein NC651_025479 [Populus alba x Populus x berolinensis]|nr:hypothetical protein NC651_025479 [Populus alba x Populus x berolinensis]